VTDSTTPSFPERIRETADRLTDADNRAIRAIMADPRAAALLSVGELAQRAQIHEATATRLAQKLGYRGYPALRDALRAQYIAHSDGAARIARSVGRVTAGGYLSDLVASELDALANLPHAIAQASLDRAADMLAGAVRVFLFARGHACALADLAERRLRRFGFDIVSLAGENRTIAERLAGLRGDDVVLAFAFRARPQGLEHAFAHADQVGAATVLIADLAAATHCPKPSLALAAARGRSGDEFQTLTVPMAILNALVLTIAARRERRSIGALNVVSALIKQFGA
jgi:DNA-binding MurR/RpiR family transcriptional regulator